MRTLAMTFIGLGMVLGSAGCVQSGPVERVPVAGPADPGGRVYREPVKPLPDHAALYDRDLIPPPPFDDPPPVNQRTPEQSKFEEGYRAVGRPRITVFVNRTLEGRLAGENQRLDDPKPALRAGQYDEGQAKALDYQAVENILTDFLACQGAIEIMSPTMVRQKLTDQQIKDLQSGKPRVLREIAQQLETDILIQVTARPTRQTEDGLEFRLVAEAVNIKGGQQIGRAVVDLLPPLDKPNVNRATRFMARKLMMDMIQSWSAPGDKPPAEKPDDGGACRFNGKQYGSVELAAMA